MRESLIFLAAFCTFLLIGARTGNAAELVMFESDSCEWCQIWHEEIGVVYAKTAEAEVAPLRRVSIEDKVPHDLAHIRGIHYTPTFVILEDGEEVGRILGYPGEDFFWGLLAIELEKLKPDTSVDHARSGVPGCEETETRERSNEKTAGDTAAC